MAFVGLGLGLVAGGLLPGWWVASWLSALSGYLAFGGVFLFFWCLAFVASGLFLLLVLSFACFGVVVAVRVVVGFGFGGFGFCCWLACRWCCLGFVLGLDFVGAVWGRYLGGLRI